MKSRIFQKTLLWENNQKNNNKLNQFESWLIRKNLTVETIKIKLRHVRQYGEQTITTDNIVDFLKENTHYSPYHLENLRNSLSSYAKFLKVHNEIEWDIISRVIPKTQPKPFSTINHEELEKLKNAYDNKRDNLILDFFLNTGLRISELVNIKHCDYQNQLLKVHGKGNKVRFIPLPSFLAKNFNHSSQYLFQTNTGKSLHPSQVRKIIYLRNRKSGLNKHISPHTFRRSFATLLNNSEVKLTTIQKLLGHSNINTTSTYIHNSYEEIASDCNRLWGGQYISLANLNK